MISKIDSRQIKNRQVLPYSSNGDERNVNDVLQSIDDKVKDSIQNKADIASLQNDATLPLKLSQNGVSGVKK